VDNVSAANVSMAQHKANASVRPVRCRKCDAYPLAWAKSKRTGKSYLCETIAGTPGKVIPLPHRPHFKNCNPTTTSEATR
jgi:hypothetical protein